MYENNPTQTHRFLLRFPPNQRGWLGNLFNLAVRIGAYDINSVLAAVEAKVEKYLASPWLTNERRELLQKFFDALSEPDADQYAEHVLAYELLPPAERDKIKGQRNEEFKRERKASQEPTPKQLKFLRRLGCVITPSNRREASDLIDELLKQKNKGGESGLLH